MKKVLIASLIMLTAGALAWPQTVVTHARIPDRETRRRMGLDLLWQLRLPMMDDRDGLFSVQVLPWRLNFPQLLVQTRAGKVFLIDGESGDIVWTRQPVGNVRTGMLAGAFNSHSIYIVRGEWLDIFNRVNGRQELYTWNRQTKQKKYGLRLKYDQVPRIPGLPPLPQPFPPPPPLEPPIATPVADEDNFIYTSGSKITCFAVPDYDFVAAHLPPPPKKEKGEPEPPPMPKEDGPPNPPPAIYMWMMVLGRSLCEQFPVISGSQVGVLEKDGTYMSMEKYQDKIRFRFRTNGRILAAAAQYNEMAYFGSEDQALYALDVENGRLLWRFLAPAPVLRKPNCNDRDVFVKVDGAGFYRIDRETGRDVWLNKQGHSFLSANRMFVYSRDPQGKLLFHDYLRGTVLATYDMSDWQVSVANEWTDRIYLGNHDGQIICMHHHDYPRFQRMKSQNWFIKKIIKKESEKEAEK